MVKFWDTSAVVPLLVDEPGTALVEPLCRLDPIVVVWWGTRVECISALARQRREGKIAAAVERDARRVLAVLGGDWSEVVPTETVRKRAERLLGLHPLRAAHALQLAAALVWSREDPTAHAIVSLDEQLRDAAGREGLEVLPAAAR